MSAQDTHPAVRFLLHNWIPIILFALTAAFIGQNRDTARIHLLWLTVESPMWLLLSAILLVGIVVGLLVRRHRRD
jgi:putative membrane protein